MRAERAAAGSGRGQSQWRRMRSARLTVTFFFRRGFLVVVFRCFRRVVVGPAHVCRATRLSIINATWGSSKTEFACSAKRGAAAIKRASKKMATLPKATCCRICSRGGTTERTPSGPFATQRIERNRSLMEALSTPIGLLSSTTPSVLLLPDLRRQFRQNRQILQKWPIRRTILRRMVTPSPRHPPPPDLLSHLP